MTINSSNGIIQISLIVHYNIGPWFTRPRVKSYLNIFNFTMFTEHVCQPILEQVLNADNIDELYARGFVGFFGSSLIGSSLLTLNNFPSSSCHTN